MCRLPLENGPRVPLSRPAAQSQRTQPYDDEFLQYTYKVVPCDKAWRHDYASCPFAHAGESSERRHPSAYLPFMCNSAQHSTDLKEKCPFGTSCKYAHGHFELWLHPGRFRTKLCSLAGNCRRPVCFFAHSEQELRVTPFSKLDTSASVAAQQLGETQGDAAAAPPASCGRSSVDGSDIKSAACSTASPYGSEASHPLLERPGGSPSCNSDAACDDSFAAFSAAMALKSQTAVLQLQQQQQSPFCLGDASLVGSSQAPGLWLANNSGAMLQQPCLAPAMQPAYGGLLPQAQQQQLMMDNAGMLAGLAAPGAGMPGADLMGSWMMAQSGAAANALPEQWPVSGLMASQQLPYPGAVQMQCLPLPRLLQPSSLDQWLAAEAAGFPPGLAAPQPSADPRVVQLLSTLPNNTVQQLLHALG